ncbi:MAG: aspartate kinase [Desulfobacterales bacterium C00003104]|nr:MAG: aspartate kinase [Desulfobacterales bacterium C00003104]
MALIVQKYGGTSVANVDRIRNVANRVIRRHQAGDHVVVVLSAMSGVTDRLIELAHQVTADPNDRELDVLLATGEQTTVALLAMMLNSMGFPAVSLLGFQAEIVTNNSYGRARIKEIHVERIKKALEQKNIVTVAGFQGWTSDRDITTLGRGGSDTSAVALAAALSADSCEIYTDVDGVYTTDPNICSKAKKLKKISYNEMLEAASLGAKVLQIRSVEFAKKYSVPIHVRSSFNEEEGTMVVKEETDMEKVAVSGIAYDKNQARITLRKVPDQPGIAAKIFASLAKSQIVVDMIIQNTRAAGLTDLTFTVSKSDYKKALEIQKKVAREIKAEDVYSDEHITKVSIIGVGMRSHSGVAGKMFSVLANENINIMMISTSEIKISCLISEKYTELAVRALHDAFELDKVED